MGEKAYLVTGGMGFLGSALVRRLIHEGYRVRVFDNESRGSADRLEDLRGAFELLKGDIRDADAVAAASSGMDGVFHLAFINGTENFYTKPDLVLDVGVKGMLNVVDACLKQQIGELFLASSSEVYHKPPEIPTREEVPLTIPDPFNARYSYAAAKIISEMLAINYGRKHFDRVVIFRPHNVYGPDMGGDHVVPQLVLRMHELSKTGPDVIRFPIQGTGRETRAFVYIDDFIDGLALVMKHGAHLGIYNIGTTEELPIETVAREIGAYFGRCIEILPGALQKGGTPRRCPNISKLQEFGYEPRYPFRDGLPPTARWYIEHADRYSDTKKVT